MRPPLAAARAPAATMDQMNAFPIPARRAAAQAPTNRTIFALAWPMTLKPIMLHGIVVVDALLVAPLGEETLAAMGLAAAIAGLLLGILFAFSTAMQIRVAQAHGTDRLPAMKSAFLCGMAVNLLAATLGLLLAAACAAPVIEAFAPTDAIAGAALRYLAVFAVVILAEAVGAGLTSQFIGSGDARMPLLSYLVSLPVNIGLSLILIHGLWGFPELGLTGAAIGSAVGAIVRSLFLIPAIRRAASALVATPVWSGGSFLAALRRHLAFSLPVAASFVSATAGLSLCRLFYARLDVNEFAAMTLILPWMQVAGTIGMCWTQATGLIVARLLGAGAPEHRLDAFLARAWRASFMAAALVALAYVAVCLGSARLYADLRPETLAALMAFLPILVLLPFPKQSNAICGNTLRAGGETVYVIKLFVVSQWLVTIPLTALFIFGFHLPVVWVFSLLLLEELVKLPLFHRRLFAGSWKKAPLDQI